MRSINIANYTLSEDQDWKFTCSETEFHDDYGNNYEIVDYDERETKLVDKLAWLKMATADQLLSQYSFLDRTNEYGCNDGDLKITKCEIIARMKEA